VGVRLAGGHDAPWSEEDATAAAALGPGVTHTGTLRQRHRYERRCPCLRGCSTRSFGYKISAEDGIDVQATHA
jgi:hypothetical protein